jgi:hypothetical protein
MSDMVPRIAVVMISFRALARLGGGGDRFELVALAVAVAVAVAELAAVAGVVASEGVSGAAAVAFDEHGGGCC